MSKKERKIFKKHAILAPKVSLNRKWTVWRQPETKNLIALSNADISKHSLKSINTNFSVHENYLVCSRLSNLELTKSVRTSISKAKNFCYYVGKSRGFNRDTFISRHAFRRLARFGLLPGLTKDRC